MDGETGGQTDCGRDTSQHANSVWEASDSEGEATKECPTDTIYGHCKFCFDNSGGSGGCDNDGGADSESLTTAKEGVPRRQKSGRGRI